MIITTKWMSEKGACRGGTEWFCNQKVTELRAVVRALVRENRHKWANWALTKAMSHRQCVAYAIYSAKQRFHIFEKAFPQDKRPRLAIRAAAEWLKNPSNATRLAALSAESARSAARSAAWSAARSAARSARSAESARSAAWSAESAAWKKILRYGLRLMKTNK